MVLALIPEFVSDVLVLGPQEIHTVKNEAFRAGHHLRVLKTLLNDQAWVPALLRHFFSRIISSSWLKILLQMQQLLPRNFQMLYTC